MVTYDGLADGSVTDGYGGGNEPMPAPALSIIPSDYQLPAGWHQGNATGSDPYVVAPDGSITYLNNIPQGAPTSLTISGNWNSPAPTQAPATVSGNTPMFDVSLGFNDSGYGGGNEPMPAPLPSIIPSDYQLPAGWHEGNATGSDPYVVAPDGSITYLSNIPQSTPTSLTISGNWNSPAPTQAPAPVSDNTPALDISLGFSDGAAIYTTPEGFLRSMLFHGGTDTLVSPSDSPTTYIDKAFFS